MEHIAIIPARAGSKGIPGKNLMTLPHTHHNLIELALYAAKNSRLFDTIIISTDYQKNKIDYSFEASFNTKVHTLSRPKELCSDQAQMIDVVKHVMKPFKGKAKWVWVLQPTSPFRLQKDFAEIAKMLKNAPENTNSVISFKPVKEHTNRVYTQKEGIAYRLRHTRVII